MNDCSGVVTHFQKSHPDEKPEDSTFKKIKFKKHIPTTVMVKKYTYSCYICTKTFRHPTFKAHFRKLHPEEKYDRSRIIETQVNEVEAPINRFAVKDRPNFPLNEGDFVCQHCNLRFQTDIIR